MLKNENIIADFKKALTVTIKSISKSNPRLQSMAFGLLSIPVIEEEKTASKICLENLP